MFVQGRFETMIESGRRTAASKLDCQGYMRVACVAPSEICQLYSDIKWLGMCLRDQIGAKVSWSLCILARYFLILAKCTYTGYQSSRTNGPSRSVAECASTMCHYHAMT